MAGNKKKLRGIKSLLGGLVAHIESGNFFHRYPQIRFGKVFCPVPGFGAQVRTPGLKRAPVNGVARDLKGYTASFFSLGVDSGAGGGAAGVSQILSWRNRGTREMFAVAAALYPLRFPVAPTAAHRARIAT